MTLLNLDEPIPRVAKWYQLHHAPVLMLAFRPLFLLGSLWACSAMLVWFAILSGYLNWSAPYPATLWHAHEMIFGFASAIAIGFLFTAAKNWTGVSTLNGWPLLGLCVVWSSARIAGVWSAQPLLWLIVLQGAFWLIAICHFTWVVVQVHNSKNYLFVPVLALLATLNIVFIVVLDLQAFELAGLLSQMAVLGFTILISILGGRVIPFFISRGLGLAQQQRTPRLDKLLLLVSLTGVAGFFAHHFMQLTVMPGYLLILAGLLHLARAAAWFQRRLFMVPLLWSLYLAYLMMALGLIGFGSAYFNTSWQAKDALHLITIGGMGMMILAMMARVALGHTARPLTPHPLMSVAFLLILTSALIRSMLPTYIGAHLAWQLSALIWSASFALFVFIYAPMLVVKRRDGRRG
ncbi:NnrS family protein [Pseudoalteromonas sp. OOF1S-7]|uniref:NnrS family protein n=1 Tax=Pseudoalteromonas sp. OOF1S-7 TaxID=2917757 RepID=UPI001EF5D3FF|nr:NnrS family protein [Pseudoalteromonas sp. OOF1S-7]MCG7534246.1 NnrS family protein [Pseudoalteromonas sp. OOF1S-7]